MLATGGNGNVWIKYLESNQIELATGNTQRLLVANTGLTVANDLTISGKSTISGDIAASGGFDQTFTFYKLSLGQGVFCPMTASILSASSAASDSSNWYKCFTKVPLMRGGSIRGLMLYTEDGVVKSGSLSASVAINGVNQSCVASMHSGTSCFVLKAKDSVSFAAYTQLSVNLTASATYLCEPNTTSASWTAAVLVEY